MKSPLALLLILGACGEDTGENAEEVITTVILEFTPAGGTPLVFEADDPDGDGGDPPVIDDVDLPAGTYSLAVGFENRLEDPPEVITEEVADEGDQHLVIFTGSAVVGPATTNLSGALTQSYADEDDGGLPIGLDNDIVAATGTGTLVVTLRHMPPELPPGKADDTLDLVAAGGVDSIGGSTDVSVSFSVTVP